jgi:MFS family permease
MPVPLLLTAFVLIGFATGPLALVPAHGRSLVPPHLLGRAITLLNIGAMGGGFLVQLISGAIIEMFVSDAGRTHWPLIGWCSAFMRFSS